MKYIEYLRLHRLVTGMSPKHIWEVLSQGQDLTEYVNNSTPWFKDYFTKWQRALTTAAMSLEKNGKDLYEDALRHVDVLFPLKTLRDIHAGRRAFAEYVNHEDNRALAGIAFALLDEKDIRPIIWKMVKGLTKNAHALRDATQ